MVNAPLVDVQESVLRALHLVGSSIIFTLLIYSCQYNTKVRVVEWTMIAAKATQMTMGNILLTVC